MSSANYTQPTQDITSFGNVDRTVRLRVITTCEGCTLRPLAALTGGGGQRGQRD